MTDTTPEMDVFMSRLWTRRIYVIGGICVLVIGSAILANSALRSLNETFRFIALLVLFMAALATTATVFVGLRMGNAGEAFGLPAGSVRALLAIGIMILFVVFGLPLVANDSRQAPERVRIAVADLSTTMDKYRADGLEARVLDYGRAARPAVPATAATATTAAVPGAAAVPAADAVVLVTDPRGGRSAEQVEFGKQLITAIITLLTTVIGFYFGSRSATDAMREGAGGTAPTPTTELDVQQKQLETRFEALKTELAGKSQALDETAGGPEPADEAQGAERQAAIDRAKATRLDIEQKRDEIGRLLAAAGAALRSLAGATAPDIRDVHERDARDNLQKATDLVAAVEQALPNYRSQVDAVVLSGAEG